MKTARKTAIVQLSRADIGRVSNYIVGWLESEMFFTEHPAKPTPRNWIKAWRALSPQYVAGRVDKSAIDWEGTRRELTAHVDLLERLLDARDGKPAKA